jgi:type I restriction enzyme S subunit
MNLPWPVKPLSELAASTRCSLQVGPFGSKVKADNYVEIGVPYLRGANINDGRFSEEDLVFLSSSFAEQLKDFWCRPGDILLVHRGTIGPIGLVPSDGSYSKYVLGNSMLKATCDTAKVNPMFVYYWFRSPMGQHYLHSRMSQTGVPAIASPLKTLREAPIPLPRRAEQDKIAATLDCLESSIELNRRMNQTLEEIARALFKFWFVDFGPVRAKAEGRWKKGESLPGMPADMWDLWPSEFEDSEIGEIPKGWKVEGLGEVSTCRREMVDPSEIDPEERYVGLEHITPLSLSLWNRGRVGDTVSGKARFKRGDVLFGKLRPYFHKVCVPSFDGVASTDILSITPKSSHWFGFILGHLDSSALVDYATAASNGTKMPRTNWADLASWQVAVPSPELAHAYSSRIAPMISKLGSAIDESGMLAAARDALLPKLLSGEIRVKVDT